MATDADRDRVEPLLEPIAVFAFVLMWCKVAVAPTLLGAIAAFVVSKAAPPPWNTVGAWGLALLGFALGAVWAERLRRRGQLGSFVAAEIATPDLDDLPAIPGTPRGELPR
jgi:hypothetical protein